MSAGTVTVTPCDSNGTWLVTLQGEHDLATRPQLEQQTKVIWPCCKVAVIDFSQVDFIDSGVVRWLLDAERSLGAAGGFTLSIVEGPPGSVASRLFGMLRVPHVFACYSTREEALTQGVAGKRPLEWRPRRQQTHWDDDSQRRHAGR
jgi:anti-anti-sigma regulatory factor